MYFGVLERRWQSDVVFRHGDGWLGEESEVGGEVGLFHVLRAAVRWGKDTQGSTTWCDPSCMTEEDRGDGSWTNKSRQAGAVGLLVSYAQEFVVCGMSRSQVKPAPKRKRAWCKSAWPVSSRSTSTCAIVLTYHQGPA